MFARPKYFKFPFRCNSNLYQDGINYENNNELIEIPNEYTGKLKATAKKRIL